MNTEFPRAGLCKLNKGYAFLIHLHVGGQKGNFLSEEFL
jgi:hypothetical protein